jgi:hypothetical protein
MHHMSPRTFYSKGPHPILWAGSRVSLGKIAVSDVSLGKIAVSDVPKSKLLCNIYRVYTIDRCGRGPHNTYNLAVRGTRFGDPWFTFPLSYFLEFSHSGGRDRVVRVCSVDMKLGTNRLRYSSCKFTAEMDFVTRWNNTLNSECTIFCAGKIT